MAEIEEHTFQDVDGSIKSYRIIRADRVRIESKDGSVYEISDLPTEFTAREYTGNVVFDSSRSNGLWHLSNELLPILHRIVREAGVGSDLLPRSIALLGEHGETLIAIANLFIYGVRSAEAPPPALLGYEVVDGE